MRFAWVWGSLKHGNGYSDFDFIETAWTSNGGFCRKNDFFRMGEWGKGLWDQEYLEGRGIKHQIAGCID